MRSAPFQLSVEASHLGEGFVPLVTSHEYVTDQEPRVSIEARGVALSRTEAKGTGDAPSPQHGPTGESPGKTLEAKWTSIRRTGHCPANPSRVAFCGSPFSPRRIAGILTQERRGNPAKRQEPNGELRQ